MEIYIFFYYCYYFQIFYYRKFQIGTKGKRLVQGSSPNAPASWPCLLYWNKHRPMQGSLQRHAPDFQPLTQHICRVPFRIPTHKEYIQGRIKLALGNEILKTADQKVEVNIHSLQSHSKKSILNFILIKYLFCCSNLDCTQHNQIVNGDKFFIGEFQLIKAEGIQMIGRYRNESGVTQMQLSVKSWLYKNHQWLLKPSGDQVMGPVEQRNPIIHARCSA